MMRGTAVIAAQSGGLTELVTHEQTGLLVPRNDVDALTHAITFMLSDRELAEEMGARARKFALDNLSVETYVNNVLLCFEKLLERKERAECAGVSHG
jgi:glycosyltransferase involved in cell wall biosynthesis